MKIDLVFFIEKLQFEEKEDSGRLRIELDYFLHYLGTEGIIDDTKIDYSDLLDNYFDR